MGMDQVVTFESGGLPTWADVSAWLAERGQNFQMRMIDGQLAFPDEEPPESWNELRVADDSGMVTLKREPSRVLCVVWGNAEPSLVLAWNALALAFAEVGGGTVTTPDGETLSAADYRSQADLPPSLTQG